MSIRFPPYVREKSYYEQITQIYLVCSRGNSQENTHEEEIKSMYVSEKYEKSILQRIT